MSLASENGEQGRSRLRRALIPLRGHGRSHFFSRFAVFLMYRVAPSLRMPVFVQGSSTILFRKIYYQNDMASVLGGPPGDSGALLQLQLADSLKGFVSRAWSSGPLEARLCANSDSAFTAPAFFIEIDIDIDYKIDIEIDYNIDIDIGLRWAGYVTWRRLPSLSMSTRCNQVSMPSLRSIAVGTRTTS